MNAGDWQRQNLDRVKRRLAWLESKADGLLCAKRTSFQHAAILKDGYEIQLYFIDTQSDLQKPKVNGVMSRMDLRHPFRLLSLYAQAMMLALLWRPNPAKVFVLGLAGGRIPALLHHCFPQAAIDCAEIDAEVIGLAQEYFGIEPEDRLRLIHQEGRAALQDARDSYDLILIDCFTGVQHTPHHLATQEFYELCDARLVQGGIVSTYLIEPDPFLDPKLRTFLKAFSGGACFRREGACVLFGGDSPAQTSHELAAAARTLAERHPFDFPLAGLARELVLLETLEKSLPSPEPLTDAMVRGY